VRIAAVRKTVKKEQGKEQYVFLSTLSRVETEESRN